MSKPLLFVNPRAGDESPSAEALAEEAEALGVETRILGPREDAGSLAGEAARDRRPVLGMAGGDGSLGSVAAAAVAQDVPFVPIPFGTRNHFARDVGFDPDDPIAALGAFAGRERRVDVGTVGRRIFLNNVSLGLYASLVHDPNHQTKNRVVAFARIAPAAFGRSRRPLTLSFDAPGRHEERRALVALVANNDYSIETMADAGLRDRLDTGLLHAYVIEAADRRTLLALLLRATAGELGGARGFNEWASPHFHVEAGHPRVHAAIDGEPIILATPLNFEIKAKALRVLVPPASSRETAGPT